MVFIQNLRNIFFADRILFFIRSHYRFNRDLFKSKIRKMKNIL